MAEKIIGALTNGSSVTESKEGWQNDCIKANKIPSVFIEGWVGGSAPHLSLNHGFLLGAIKEIPEAYLGDKVIELADGKFAKVPVCDAGLIFDKIVSAGCKVLGIEAIALEKHASNRSGAKTQLKAVVDVFKTMDKSVLEAVKLTASKEVLAMLAANGL